MANSVDPKENTDDDRSTEAKDIGELPPSEDLTLRVEQLFEEAEELWQWMYNN